MRAEVEGFQFSVLPVLRRLQGMEEGHVGAAATAAAAAVAAAAAAALVARCG